MSYGFDRQPQFGLNLRLFYEMNATAGICLVQIFRGL